MKLQICTQLHLWSNNAVELLCTQIGKENGQSESGYEKRRFIAIFFLIKKITVNPIVHYMPRFFPPSVLDKNLLYLIMVI